MRPPRYSTPMLAALFVLCCATAAKAYPVGVLGNDTSTHRTNSSDGVTTVFWTNAYGAPVAGTVSEVTVRYQGDSGSFELFQLRPTGLPEQYSVIARSGSITPSGTSGTILTYAFPGGSGAATEFHLQPGDMLAHYGRNLPYTLDTHSAALGNHQRICFPVNTAPSVNGTISFSDYGGTTRRDFAWSVELPGFVETIGAGAGKAPDGPDADTHLVVLDDAPFTAPGKLTTWQWFNDTENTGDRNLTPVLLRDVDDTLTAIGIGATRVGNVNGFQQFAFDLVAGTNVVEPGDLFGFYYGDGTSAGAGSVQYRESALGPAVRLFSGIEGIGLGELGGTSISANRWYSINASTIPEPGTSMLLLLASVCALLVRRPHNP